MEKERKGVAYYHLPGLFEFYEFYKVFMEVFRKNREFFYEWCDIGSIYGSPTDCLWGGGRVEESNASPEDVLRLLENYGISARLTLSNSLLAEEDLKDKRCNELCALFNGSGKIRNGAIVYSDMLLEYLGTNFPSMYFVSSTTKCITDFDAFLQELNREEFEYVVPDFRLNKRFDRLENVPDIQKKKVEFLCNECCYFGCNQRQRCYEEVSRKNLGEVGYDFHCAAPGAIEGYRFSKAMENPGFISVEDILDIYMPMGFSNFKIEGRGLGSALILEFILYYMTRPECQLKVREKMYLDSSLDLF